jgi:heptosyltransferase-2
MISVLGSDETKTLPFKYMAKVLDQIVATKPESQLLFNYIPKQVEDANAIFNLCKLETQQHIRLDVFGSSLRDFICITSFCTALIGNEGGAVNMAKAVNVPTFTIFSPWIKKETWSLFENEATNVSVHLKDYLPEWFENKATKDLKAEYKRLYDMFNPKLYLQQLNAFLK